MRISVGADRRGLAVHTQVTELLQDLGHDVLSVDASDDNSKDYPDVAIRAAGMVSRGEADRAVLLAGVGIEMCIAANKLPGVRAAVCVDEWTAAVGRRTFDSNVLCMSVEMLGDEPIAGMLVDLWLATEFEGEYHLRRIEKILELEQGLLRSVSGTWIASSWRGHGPLGRRS